MPKGFLPNADGALLGWAENFARRINVDPSALNIAPERAAKFAELTEAYRGAYAITSNVNVRSRSVVATKNNARAALRDAAKLLALTIHGCPAVSAGEKLLLGLTVAKERPSPAQRPQEAPMISVAAAPGLRVEVRLYSRSGTRGNARPAGVTGALVFSWSGEGDPPADLGEWRFELNTGRRRFSLQFPPDGPPGRRVYVTARWYNGRKQHGPFADPRSTELFGGGVPAFTQRLATAA